ncbi:hypothetical protein HPP92_006928 [Vanilla planifolia]|uniref:PsbP C-terminal domain-containing protein n=1 Tax=Vanilla planifolia TaxID=51239 RepID=A0A835RLD7_VANPL|nr:hypothetical protein HPP92_006928 [Vanilla planifolia]
MASLWALGVTAGAPVSGLRGPRVRASIRGRSPAEELAPLVAIFRRRLLAGALPASLVALGANFGGLTSFVLGFLPETARRLRLDVLYPVQGFTRCFDPERGFEFIFPEDWVGDQTLLSRAVGIGESQRPLDPPPLGGGKPSSRSSRRLEPTVAFGPPGSTKELNVSVIVSPVPRDFSIEAFGSPKEVGESVLKKIADSRRGSEVRASLLDAALRRDPSMNMNYYKLEFAVEGRSFHRHNVAVCAAHGGKLFTLNAQAPEASWPALLLSISCTFVEVGAAKDRPPAVFVFGDSHVDSGNNNYLLTSLSKANHPPNGIDFAASGGMPTGRFTNGRTMADTIGEELGQQNFAPPFLDPYTTGAAILNGVNYASGAGGILNKSGALYVSRLGMDLQIDYFNTTRKQLDEFLGQFEAKELVKNAIFSITIGANDFLNNYLTFISDLETPNTYINRLMVALKGQLTRLYYLDARKVVMGSIVPIGCIPYQTSLAPVDETGCAELPNQLAMQYNGELKKLLTELNQQLPGANFLYANLYDIFMEIIKNHQSYGFETATDACCGNGGVHGGIIVCGPASSLCQDRSKYVYWDPYHPTEAANLIVAKKLVHGDERYISPINVQQLNI